MEFIKLPSVFFLVLVCCVSIISCEFCYATTKKACDGSAQAVNCTAKYGAAHEYMKEVDVYANIHILRSFQYLLMSSHFGNFEKQRDGFKKLFRKLSDTAWNDAIDLIKYITMRGGKMNFHYDDGSAPGKEIVEMTEIEGLAKSLDIQKKLATKAHSIYKLYHTRDPEVSSFIEGKFMHKHASTVRELSGYTYDLAKLIKGEDNSNVAIGMYLFDSYLGKTL